MSRRTTVTLTDREESALAIFEDKSRAEWTLLQMIAAEHGLDLTESSSEATIMRVLMAAGLQQLRDRVLDRGYAHMAELYEQDEDLKAERREFLRRYADRVDRNMPG